MIKIVISILCAAFLTACAATGTGPSNKEIADFWTDHKSRVQAAAASGGKLMPVYIQSYNKIASMPETFDTAIYMNAMSKMASYASEHDKGNMSLDDLKLKSLEVFAEAKYESQKAKQNADAEKTRKIQASNQILNNFLMQQNQRNSGSNGLIQNSTCDTKLIGGMYRTQCY